MNDIDELKLILDHREQQIQHCNFVFERILLLYAMTLFHLESTTIRRQY